MNGSGSVMVEDCIDGIGKECDGVEDDEGLNNEY